MADAPLQAFLVSEQFDTTALSVQHVVLREAISKLFELDLVVVAESAGDLPDFDDVAGAEVALELRRGSEVVKTVHGMVAQVRALDDGQAPNPVLKLRVVPVAWMSQLVETLDIYLEQSIVEIIEGKLALVDLVSGEDFEMRLNGSYRQREFVVQYKETDLAFISRLAEHDGISFFFEHSTEASCMVFSDGIEGHRAIAGETVRYQSRGDQIDVFALEVERNVIPGTYVCRDYNYRSPAIELMAQHPLEEGFGGGIVEYGSHAKSPEEIARYAEIRAQERLAQRDVFVGKSTCLDFHPGATFTLEDYARMDEALLLTEVVHQLGQAERAATDGAQGYSNTFRAVPAGRPFRPARVTPKPRISGLVTGIVETRQGEVRDHAELDDEGRYRVRFLFDTAPAGERKASKRVRQIQPSAGPGYGIHFPLKPGVEVALAFVDGDPDRPLIVGAVPNPITPTPVAARHHTANRIQSRAGILVEIEDGAGNG
jgi:type VI secretion system secreted protein VgrG